MTLTEKIETSVNCVISRTTASAPTTASAADQHRHRRGDQAAEDQHREQGDHGQRHRLGPLEVLLGALVDVVVDRERPGQVGLQALGLELGRELVVGGEVVVLRLTGERDQHLRGVAVAC